MKKFKDSRKKGLFQTPHTEEKCFCFFRIYKLKIHPILQVNRQVTVLLNPLLLVQPPLLPKYQVTIHFLSLLNLLYINLRQHQQPHYLPLVLPYHQVHHQPVIKFPQYLISGNLFTFSSRPHMYGSKVLLLTSVFEIVGDYLITCNST